MASRGELVGSYPSRANPSALLHRLEVALSWCEARLAKRVVWIIAICCAALLQTALIVAHRPWLDEWQALLIARDTPSLSSMLAQLHYEGHPQLWYLILRSAGAAFPGDWAFTAVNLALAALAWWAILTQSPFRRVERLLIVTNEILIFEMLTVSRSLTLGVALVFLTLALWRSRLVWVALALLPLCDFFFGAMACALIAIRYRDRQDKPFPYSGAVLFISCSLIAAWAVIPAKDVLTTPPRGWLPGLVSFCRDLGTLAFPLQIDLYDTPLPVFAGLILAPVFLYVCADALRRDLLARMLLFAFLGLILLFGCVIYPVYYRHTALAAVLIIALVWIESLKGRSVGTPFRAWLCVAALCGLVTSAVNLLLPFDTAAQAATIIRQQKLDNKLWVSFPSFRTLALTGESGVRFGDLEHNCAVGFMRWNFLSGITTHEQFYVTARNAERRYGSYYLVKDVPLPAELARRIAIVRAGNDGVRYSLWKVGDGPASEVRLPSCVPGLANAG